MNRRWLAGSLVVFLVGLSTFAHAGSDDTTNTVTITVKEVLSIIDDTGNFTLTFDDFTEGEESNVQQVKYTVKSNNMVVAALDGVVSAKISALVSGIDLKGDVETISNEGSSGNVVLKEQNSGFVTVGTSVVNMAKKDATTAPQGKVLNGIVTINWKGVATKDLPADTHTTNLTVTLKNA